jgi:hypothetical protein
VVDPGMVLIQLPFVGGIVGAVVELAALIFATLRRRARRPRQLAVRALALIAAGGMCYLSLFLYDRYLDRLWDENPPRVQPLPQMEQGSNKRT